MTTKMSSSRSRRQSSRAILLALAIIACLSMCASAGSTVDWLQGGGEEASPSDASEPSSSSQTEADAPVGDDVKWNLPEAKDKGQQLEMEDLIKARDTADQNAADDAVLSVSNTQQGSGGSSKSTTTSTKSHYDYDETDNLG